MKYLFITAFLLMTNIQWSTSLDISEPLNRLERAVLSEDPVHDIGRFIDETFSSENVQSLVRGTLDGVVGSLESRLAGHDALELLINLLVEFQEDRFEKLHDKFIEVGDDIGALVKLFNNEVGCPVLLLNNDALAISADGIAKIVQRQAADFAKTTFKDNFFLQFSVQQTINDEIKKVLPTFRSILSNNQLPLTDIKKFIAAARSTEVTTRSKRDLSFPLNVLVPMVRAYFEPIVSPVKENICSFLDNATSLVLNFYIADEQSHPVLAVVLNFTNTVITRVAETLVIAKGYINTVYYIIFNATDLTFTSRRRRDLEYEEVDLTEFFSTEQELEESHSRVRRNVITNILSAVVSFISNVISSLVGILSSFLSSLSSVVGNFWSVISTYLNSYLKNLFINWLSAYYAIIGEYVTYPLRYVVNYVINVIFACSSCTSIV